MFVVLVEKILFLIYLKNICKDYLYTVKNFMVKFNENLCQLFLIQVLIIQNIKLIIFYVKVSTEFLFIEVNEF